MAGPFDYTIDIQSPFTSLTQGLQLGAGIADIRAQQQARELKMQQEQAALEQQRMMQQEVQGFLTNPTAKGVLRLSTLMPAEQAKSVREGWAALDSDTAKKRISQVSQVSSALMSSTPEVGINMLMDMAEGARNAGKEDEAKQYEAYAETAKVNPRFAALTALVPMAGTEEGKRAIETMLVAQKAPAEVAKGEAEATASESDARLKREKAETESKRFAAELGLTHAQTASALANAKKLSADAQKAAMELEFMKENGGLDPAKMFDQEEKLRKEYNTRTNGYLEARDAFGKIKVSALDKTGAGDIALITSFMKMLDPGSVVRETEFATARNTAGLLSELQNKAQQLQNGAFLDEKQRVRFLALAAQYMKAAEQEEKIVRGSMDRIVKNYKLNPENVFADNPATPPVDTDPTPAQRQKPAGSSEFTVIRRK